LPAIRHDGPGANGHEGEREKFEIAALCLSLVSEKFNTPLDVETGMLINFC
jgi:hypothetical protein